jgi:cbb3-type cytochrome oxidase subunit 3
MSDYFNVIIHHAPLIGMFFFLFVFVGAALWAYWPSHQAHWHHCAHIPLDDGHDSVAPTSEPNMSYKERSE